MMWRYAIFAVWAAALAALPFYGDLYLVRISISVAMFTAMACSWNIIGGYMGYPSFSTAAFFGLGAYAGAISQNAGVPMVLAWVFATLLVAAVSFFVGHAVLRLRGHYFAIGTIAIVEMFRLLISGASGITGGGDGLNVALVRGSPSEVLSMFLYAMLVLMVLAFILNAWVGRNQLGFGLRCIRQNEDASEMVGIDTTRYKIAAYALSSMLCGTVGATYASWVGYIDPTDSFDILLTLKVPVMVMLGGLGTVLGPVVGAALFIFVEETVWARFLDWNRAVLGAFIVFLIFFLPGGLLALDHRTLRARLPQMFGARPKKEAAQ